MSKAKEWRELKVDGVALRICEDGTVINAVTSQQHGKKYKPSDPLRYRNVVLNGKLYPIHRLVAMAFHPNSLSKPYVNHKDGNKANNKASNLEWVTGSENAQHAKQLDKHRYGRMLIKGYISKKAGRKLKEEAKSEKRSFKAQCMHILEQHAEGDNGIYRALHPVKQRKTK